MPSRLAIYLYLVCAFLQIRSAASNSCSPRYHVVRDVSNGFLCSSHTISNVLEVINEIKFASTRLRILSTSASHPCVLREHPEIFQRPPVISGLPNPGRSLAISLMWKVMSFPLLPSRVLNISSLAPWIHWCMKEKGFQNPFKSISKLQDDRCYS